MCGGVLSEQLSPGGEQLEGFVCVTQLQLWWVGGGEGEGRREEEGGAVDELTRGMRGRKGGKRREEERGREGGRRKILGGRADLDYRRRSR